MINDQAAGLGGKVVAGTVRDSLHMIDVLFNQDGGQRPDIVVSDTGSYSDLVFGLVTLLGVQYRPALADLPDRKGRRISQSAGDGPLNAFARGKIDLGRIRAHWHDILRVVVSIYTGEVRAHDVVPHACSETGTPPRSGRRSPPTAASPRHCTSAPWPPRSPTSATSRPCATCSRAWHALAAKIFYGKKGELYQRYHEGMEDQPGALGLILNRVVLWTTRYISAALRAQGYPVLDEDVARLSPFVREHVNVIGKYNFLGSRHHPAQKQRLGSRPVTRGRIAWFYCACRPCQIGVPHRGLLFGKGRRWRPGKCSQRMSWRSCGASPTLPVLS